MVSPNYADSSNGDSEKRYVSEKQRLILAPCPTITVALLISILELKTISDRRLPSVKKSTVTLKATEFESREALIRFFRIVMVIGIGVIV